MNFSLKSIARNILPHKYQVPAKYWFGALRGELEDEINFLKYLVKPEDLVIDVGANRGVYAYKLWRLGVIVEAFEPNPVCLSLLAAWAQGKSTVHLHPEALSNQDGSANLYIPIDEMGVEHDASATIEQVGFTKSRSQSVMLRTLDSFGLQGISLIKIDVEGHEQHVLEGARATISHSRPALIIEIEQRHISVSIDTVFEKVRRLNYAGYFIENGRISELRSFDITDHQSMANFNSKKGHYINNFIFLHVDRVANGEYAALFYEK